MMELIGLMDVFWIFRKRQKVNLISFFALVDPGLITLVMIEQKVGLDSWRDVAV